MLPRVASAATSKVSFGKHDVNTTSDVWKRVRGRMADAGQESSEGISVSKPVARVMMLVNAAVWGSGYTMLKHVQENMPTQWMMFFRMASAVLLMAIVFSHVFAGFACAAISFPV